MNAAKTQLRAARRAARAGRTAAGIAATGRALVTHLLAGLNERGARSVAGYVPVGSEPGMGDEPVELPEALRAAGVAVLLPLFRADRDLDWAWYDGLTSLVRSDRGLWEPDPATLVGLDAVAGVDLVVVPALAVGWDGARLGRGAGCYDRALTRVPRATPVVALIYDDEFLEHVPTEPHDRFVNGVITPTDGWRTVAPAAELR